MRTIQNDYYKVTYFDSTVYMAEANIITIDCIGEYWQASLSVPSLGRVATYSAGADRRITIDVSDILRTYAAELASNKYLEVLTPLLAQPRLRLSWTATGLYDVSQIVRPNSPYAEQIRRECGGVRERDLMPPSCMVSDINATRPLKVLIGDERASISVYYRNAYNARIVSRGDDGLYSIPLYESRSEGTFRTEGISVVYNDCNVTIPITEVPCGRRMAYVRWQFPDGHTVQHYCEVRDVTDVVSESYALRTMDGSYNVHKGSGQTASLYFERMDAYDYWYFGTIVTSSMVEVSMDGGSTWRQVEVTTKNVKHPNNVDGKREKMSIAFNYIKHVAL